jgi:hypothetical protein
MKISISQVIQYLSCFLQTYSKKIDINDPHAIYTEVFDKYLIFKDLQCKYLWLVNAIKISIYLVIECIMLGRRNDHKCESFPDNILFWCLFSCCC